MIQETLEKTQEKILLPELKKEELNLLTSKDFVRPSIMVITTFLEIVLVFLTYKLMPTLAIYILCFILISGLQHKLSIILHEAVHYTLFPNKVLNNIIGAIAAYSIFFTLYYRELHLNHHKHLGREEDPDLEKYKNYPNNLPYLLFDFLKHITGLAAIQQAVTEIILKKKNNQTKQSFDPQLIGVLFVQSLLVFAISIFFSPGLYLLLWVLPLLTLTKTLTHFRNVAEHTLTRDLGDLAISRYRTIKTNFLESFFFSPLNFNYHSEHHLYTSIPYYHLPKAHKILSKQKEYPASAELEKGYLDFIFTKVISK